MGVLRWLEHLALEPSFFKVASDSYIVYLILLDEVLLLGGGAQFIIMHNHLQIASHHKLQHPVILNLLTLLFEASYPELGAEEQVMTKHTQCLCPYLLNVAGVEKDHC